MDAQATYLFRLVYCLVLIAAAVPFGIAEAGWVGLVIGGVGLGLVPSLGPAIFIGLALYRIVLVATNGRTLDSPRVSGFIRWIRLLGVLLLYVGALSAIVSWIVRPLMMWLVPERSDIGVEFFTELYLYLVGGVGLLGLALFEFGRLLAFERHARQPGAPRSRGGVAAGN